MGFCYLLGPNARTHATADAGSADSFPQRRARRAALAAVLLVMWAPLAVHADWRLKGGHTWRYDYYDVSGDERSSPYRELGGFSYNEFDLSLTGTTAPGVSWRFDFAGVSSRSPYRSAYDGWSAEALRVVHENKAAVLPYRIQFGDVSASLSPLTFRRAFKGVNLTLAPQSELPGRSYHIDLFTGRKYRDWMSLGDPADEYRGLSIGVADARLGELDFNFAHSRDTDGDSQYVASLAAERRFSAGGQALLARGEWAKLFAPGVEGGEDAGYFLELSGRDLSRPLEYQFRYDRYGADFEPAGAAVAEDTEAMAVEAGWTFDSDVKLEGSVQRVLDRISSGSPVRTNSVGVTMAGPLKRDDPDKLNGQVNVVAQDRKNDAGSVDAHSINASVGVNVRQNEANETRMSVSYSGVDDHRYAGTERITRQLSLSHRTELDMGRLSLGLAPGLSYRESESYGSSETLGPTLSLEAARGRHRLDLSLGTSAYESDDPADGVDLSRFSLDYQFKYKQHVLGVDLERSLRDPAEGESTDAWRAGLYWRYEFDTRFGA